MTVQEYGFEPKKFIETATEEIRAKVGSQRCILAISGGVDSTTCGVLMHRALGSKLLPVFIDTGFMRQGETEEIKRLLTSPPLSLPLRVIEAKERFLRVLEGVSDAEEKRKTFREEFYRTLGEETRRENITILGQGTIAPDWIETSGGIKTQHNILEQVGINPKERFGFQVLEPLSELYKDQVRAVAEALGISAIISQRQPFPGPGLLVRCIGAVDEGKLEVTRASGHIFESELQNSKIQSEQYFTAALDSKLETGSTKEMNTYLAQQFQTQKVGVTIPTARVTGVKGDIRVYGELGLIVVPSEDRKRWIENLSQLVDIGGRLVSHFPRLTRVLYAVKEAEGRGEFIVALRAINTRDFMTAEVTKIPWQILEETAGKVLASSRKVTSVYYDITPKPPATVEFE